MIRPRVLVVGVRPADGELFSAPLGTWYGYEVTIVADLADALAAMDRGPDVVLLDLALPDARGLQTFNRLSERRPDVPIIVLTELDDSSVAAEALRGGAQDYLVKGADDHRVVERAVRYAIERHRRQAALKAVATMGHELAGSLEPAALRARFVATARALLRVRRVVFYDGDGVDQPLVCTASDGVDADCVWLGSTVMPGEGVVGLAVRTGRLVSSSAALSDASVTQPPWAAALLAREGCAVVTAVPIVARGRTLGGLAVGDAAGRTFTGEDLELLTTFADQAALALDAARRLRDTETLVAAGRTVGASLDLTETMRRLAGVVRAAFDVDMVGAYLADADEQAMRAVAGANVPPALVDAFRAHPFPVWGHPFVEESWRTRRSVCSDDAASDPRIDRDTWTKFPHQAVTFVPMVVGDRVIGGLFLVWWKRAVVLTEAQCQLAEAISGQAAVAVANARLYDEAQRRRLQAEATANLGRALTETRGVQAVAERTVETVRPLLRARAAILALRRSDGSLERLAVARDPVTDYTPAHVWPAHVGLAGRVASTGRTLWCSDVSLEPELGLTDVQLAPLRDAGVQAALAAPLHAKERTIGVLTIVADTGTRFLADDIELLESCADTAALALDNALLDEDRGRREREAEVLAIVARSIVGSLDLDVVLQRIGEAAKELCSARHVSVAVREPDGAAAIMRYSYDGPRGPFTGLRVEPGKGSGGLVLLSGEPFRTDNYATDPRITKDYLHTVDVDRGVCQMVIPIRGDDRVEGLIYIERSPAEPFGDREEAILLRLADHAAIALKNAQALEREQASAVALRESEEKLRQAYKMEAVGRLAGGIAHDFNNLLTVISGRAAMLIEDFGEAPAARRQAEIISESAQRAAIMTRQLLAFSRKQVLQPTVLDVDAVVAGLAEILGRLIGEHITLAFEPGAGVHTVKADRSQLEQVFMNLCVNARDAMRGGGRLVIETSTVAADEPVMDRELELAPGTYVVLAVTDTGCGMAPDVVARIFEPFFTTKGPDGGTGLGLATVYGIVKQSGGDIAVSSEVGRGTTFRIYLPAIAGDVVVAPPAPRRASMSGSETILLVEDEGEVRKVTAEMLTTAGYSVVQARDAAEALAIARRRPGGFALLLTDVIMPGMNGKALAVEVRALCPDVVVLFMSGYTDAVIAEHGVLERDAMLLPKPFTAQALRTKVREALGAGG